MENIINEPTNSFVCYRSFFEITSLFNDEQKLMYYDVLFNYAFNGNYKKSGDFMVDTIFINTCKELIDANFRKRKGGAPKGNKNAMKKLAEEAF